MTQPFIPGQLFVPEASFLNDLLDMLASWKRSGGRWRQSQPSAADYSIFKIKNNSGAARDRFDILGIDDPLFDLDDEDESNFATFKNVTPLKGVDPANPTHIGRFAVLLQPVQTSGVVEGLIFGRTVAKIQVTDEDHKFADIWDVGDSVDGAAGADDHYRLVSRDFGAAEILWKETGTGDKWAVLRLGPLGNPVRQFQLKDPLNHNSFATAYLRFGEVVSDIEFEVKENDAIFTGEGESEGFSGENGRAVWNQHTRIFEVEQLACGPTPIEV